MSVRTEALCPRGRVAGAWRARGGRVAGAWRARGGRVAGAWRARGGRVAGACVHMFAHALKFAHIMERERERERERARLCCERPSDERAGGKGTDGYR